MKKQSISLVTIGWWRAWVLIGKLIRALKNIDDWVRAQYSRSLVKEAIRRGYVNE